jgi:hypothetical protein
MPNRKLTLLIALVAGALFGIAFGRESSTFGGIVTGILFAVIWFFFFPPAMPIAIDLTERISRTDRR